MIIIIPGFGKKDDPWAYIGRGPNSINYNPIYNYNYNFCATDNNNLNNHVNFIFDCNNIQNILFKYDYAFHCSTSETGPLVLLEYMAHGIPFLTGNTGHIINFLKRKLDLLIIDKN